jgi:hypothetical protein
MSRLFRQLHTTREIDHCSQGSLGHRRDKEEGEERRDERWVLLPSILRVIPAHDFSRVQGRDYRVKDGKLCRVDSAEMIEHIKAEKRARSHYYGLKKRGAKASICRIKCESPINELTITASPWVAEFMAQMATKDPEKVADSLAQIAEAMIPKIEEMTRCEVFGICCHFDTSSPHFGVLLGKVRKDETGIFRLACNGGMKLAGGWVAMVARQRFCEIYSAQVDAKFERAISRFRARYSDADMPTDLSLCRIFDELAETIFGSLKTLRDLYRDRIERSRAGAFARRKAFLEDQLKALEKTGIALQPSPKKEVYHGKN